MGTFDYSLWLTVCSVTGIFAASIPLLMKETRSDVLLTRIAKKMRKETGDHRYRARVEDERASLKTLIYISCTRPLCTFLNGTCAPQIAQLIGIVDLMITEPVVASFSV